MNLDAMIQPILEFGRSHGVNPGIFAALYFGCTPLFWLSVAWLVRNLRRRESIVLPALLAVFFFVAAYLYLLLFGHDFPAWVYVAVVVVVGVGAVLAVRSIRERTGPPSTEAERGGGAGPPEEYDLVVLGAGAAGLTAAAIGAQLAARTLLVEEDRPGGDCTWHGCVPSKALLHAASVVQAARTAGRYGLEPAELGVDLGKVLARVHEIQEEIYRDADQPSIYEQLGAHVKQARARFVGAHALELRAEGQAPRVVRFRYAVIATGSRPAVPTIAGLEQVPYLTNETIFQLERLPPRLLVLGGGPIGVEMAQAFQRLGSRVTILERGERLLPHDDAEHGLVLTRALEAEGVAVHLAADVRRVERAGEGVRIAYGRGGVEQEVEADALLVATGRRPRIEDLGLDAAGVAATARGVTVDDRCRTSRKHIYACGDVVGELMFTHVAEHMAKIALTNALLGLPSKLDREAVPWVTFTDPEVAHVGASEAELTETGRRFRVYRFPYSGIDRALTQRTPLGEIKVLATRHTGRILGASIVGAGAGELIAELGLAFRHRIPLRGIADTIHAYPTLALGNRRVADQWYIENASPVFLRVLKLVRGLRGTVPAGPRGPGARGPGA
ncbi:MAG: FAD-dependent oxidoreductase [Candidatus Eisenbacteria bacterium]